MRGTAVVCQRPDDKIGQDARDKKGGQVLSRICTHGEVSLRVGGENAMVLYYVNAVRIDKWEDDMSLSIGTRFVWDDSIKPQDEDDGE